MPLGENTRMNRRSSFITMLLIVSVLVLAACVPESNLESAPGGANDISAEEREEIASLTPIPESELPELPPLELDVGTVDVTKAAGNITAEITLDAEDRDNLQFAGVSEVEWSDGEVSNALLLTDEGTIFEARRADPGNDVYPVTLQLNKVSRSVGTDADAEITADAITTQWGTFPVLSIEEASRPNGWHLNYQAAGNRWVSSAAIRRDMALLNLEGSAEAFNPEYRPLLGSLRFGPEFTELEPELPLPAGVEVREAIRELRIDLEGE